jgi:hypothetical protein
VTRRGGLAAGTVVESVRTLMVSLSLLQSFGCGLRLLNNSASFVVEICRLVFSACVGVVISNEFETGMKPMENRNRFETELLRELTTNCDYLRLFSFAGTVEI